jgi:hypothetical protein
MKDEGSDKIHRMLDEIQRRNFSYYMDMCYKSMISYPEQVIGLNLPLESKLATMDRIIQHFADRDEFEKCNELNKIKIEIK